MPSLASTQLCIKRSTSTKQVKKVKVLGTKQDWIWPIFSQHFEIYVNVNVDVWYKLFIKTLFPRLFKSLFSYYHFHLYLYVQQKLHSRRFSYETQIKQLMPMYANKTFDKFPVSCIQTQLSEDT